MGALAGYGRRAAGVLDAIKEYPCSAAHLTPHRLSQGQLDGAWGIEDTWRATVEAVARRLGAAQGPEWQQAPGQEQGPLVAWVSSRIAEAAAAEARLQAKVHEQLAEAARSAAAGGGASDAASPDGSPVEVADDEEDHDAGGDEGCGHDGDHLSALPVLACRRAEIGRLQRLLSDCVASSATLAQVGGG